VIRWLLPICLIAGMGCSGGSAAADEVLCDQFAVLDRTRDTSTLDEETRLVEELTPPELTDDNEQHQRLVDAFITLWVAYRHPSVVDEMDRDQAVGIMRAECDGDVPEASRLIAEMESRYDTSTTTSSTR
jgi:hypothetical protein